MAFQGSIVSQLLYNIFIYYFSKVPNSERYIRRFTYLQITHQHYLHHTPTTFKSLSHLGCGLSPVSQKTLKSCALLLLSDSKGHSCIIPPRFLPPFSQRWLRLHPASFPIPTPQYVLCRSNCLYSAACPSVLSVNSLLPPERLFTMALCVNRPEGLRSSRAESISHI